MNLLDISLLIVFGLVSVCGILSIVCSHKEFKRWVAGLPPGRGRGTVLMTRMVRIFVLVFSILSGLAVILNTILSLKLPF